MLTARNQSKKSFNTSLARLHGLLAGAARGRRGMASLSERDIDAMARRVILPSIPISNEEMARATHQDYGQRLARQDRWEELCARIRQVDSARLATPGGESAALLLAFGARSDVVSAAEDALLDGAEPDPGGIEALEEVLEEQAGDPACALVVALAHLDIAWAWHGIAFENRPQRSLTRARRHLERAAQILAPHDGAALDAPSILAARCALAATTETDGTRLAEACGALIALDPEGPRHMRAMGRHLAPFLRQQPNLLEVAARRVAAQTADAWRAGGYAWVYLDALAMQPAASEMLDAEFFIEGMRDIIARRMDQHVINQFAAFCAISMLPPEEDEKLSPSARAARRQVHDCLDWILSEHLRELHPLVWSQTLLEPGTRPMPLSRRALVTKGRQTALRIIASRFAAEIADGSAIAFSPQGMYRMPAL